MTRRELLRLTGASLLYSGLSPIMGLASTSGSSAGRRIFFDPKELARIRANTRTPLLAPIYNEWAASPLQALGQALDEFDASGDIIRDFIKALRELAHSSLVQLADPSAERETSILEAIDRIIKVPNWDYFRDGETVVLGIQRSSFATVRLLFAREVLGEAIDAELDKRLVKAIGDKGCQTCYNTIYDMEHPDTVKGWDFDERHAGYYDITMERWPMILGANNLRAAPTGALGLGALALQGLDPRADLWLEAAVASTRRFLTLFSPDGSYFEGISYLGYSLRTTLPFINAHRALVGDVDWTREVNMDGILDYIMTMQLGKRPDGRPDVVNFSDSRESVFPGAISLIGDYTGNPMAGYAAREAGKPDWIYDFLWYKPDAPAEPPRKELLNWRNDLNWIITRSGWEPDDAVMAFKSGAPANHEHADRNHIIYKRHGERLLNDHFGASYDRRNPGWLMRQTAGHNSILIDGKGQHYVEGLEGTNDSQSYANILQYVDKGDRLWWTSDATAAYIPYNYHAHQVLRTVIFAKPDIFVVIDQIQLRYRPQVVEARFYPDNADAQARLETDGNRFTLARPKAVLHGLVASDTGAVPLLSRLEVPAETGDFPCVSVQSPVALEHRLVTVLAATRGGASKAPEMFAGSEGNKWTVMAGNFRAEIEMTSWEPRVTLL